jgi:hypothetical protein
VTGRGRTCDAPRFKRALYRLSYGHVNAGPPTRSRARTERPAPHQGDALSAELSAVDVACLSSPRGGARRTCGRSDALWSRIATLVILPTKLFTPLTYPSTLDRGRAAASYVEGCWSPVLNGVSRIFARASNTYVHAQSGDTTRRAFLSQAGPQLESEYFKLSITF